MGKSTTYSKLNNTLIVISFNQPTGEKGEIQPVVIEARTEAVTDEGAVRNVTNTVKLGEPVETKLTNEELFKTVYGISPVLAESLKGVLFDAISEDMSEVSVVGIKPAKVADIVTDVIK